jgi:hypothetical protein
VNSFAISQQFKSLSLTGVACNSRGNQPADRVDTAISQTSPGSFALKMHVERLHALLL